MRKAPVVFTQQDLLRPTANDLSKYITSRESRRESIATKSFLLGFFNAPPPLPLQPSRLRAIALKPYLQDLFLLFFHIPSINTYSTACPVVSLKQIARFQGKSDHIHTCIS
jgi:hypothetical protein